MMRNNWLWTLVALFALAGLSYGLYQALQSPPLPAGLLYGNGHIEGTAVTVSAEIAAVVTESGLVEGREVQQGELLVRLDDAEFKTRRVRGQAQAVAIQRSQTAAEEQLRTWRHHLTTAESDLTRFRELRQRGTISPQQLSQMEDRFREAQGRVGALEAQIAEIRARLIAAEQEVTLLQQQLEKTEIRAPLTGTVQTKTIEVGELATPGRAMAVLVDLSQVELKVYIPESDIGKVKLGDLARVRVDAFPDRYFEATVSRVDQRAQFTPKDVHMPDERARLVFGVVLAVDNTEGYLKPGMPADAWVRWKPEASWPNKLTVPL
ncbi:MAG: efflux RND transporter periplasmic adaptor subunit [Gammaproteobacteria bacterium]|nr:efflux RND transporter periplasmic adaptor subunit [Gammaproteobacteria bacterium]